MIPEKGLGALIETFLLPPPISNESTVVSMAFLKISLPFLSRRIITGVAPTPSNFASLYTNPASVPAGNVCVLLSLLAITCA
ncbi:hypothetical protein [uncultured Prevotella sp.]|uniref:hypothetical protein n=1 Tax=uncultured Prevotella sp. TaxID=159272 RepID=UPI0026234BD1|nr:hypothetical protein [uncultured Prevotella sp.]